MYIPPITYSFVIYHNNYIFNIGVKSRFLGNYVVKRNNNLFEYKNNIVQKM